MDDRTVESGVESGTIQAAPVEGTTVRPFLSVEQQRLVESVRHAMRGLAAQAVKRLGGNLDDLHQMAMEIACRRVVDYSPDKGSFLTYVYDAAWFSLVDACDIEKRNSRFNAVVARGAVQIAPHLKAGETIDDFFEDRQEVFLTARLSVAISAILAFYPDPATPEERVLSAERRAHLRKRVDDALASLDEIDRRLVVRVHLENVPLTQAARELGIAKYSEARKRHEGALARLGKRLKGVG